MDFSEETAPMTDRPPIYEAVGTVKAGITSNLARKVYNKKISDRITGPPCRNKKIAELLPNLEKFSMYRKLPRTFIRVKTEEGFYIRFYHFGCKSENKSR